MHDKDMYERRESGPAKPTGLLPGDRPNYQQSDHHSGGTDWCTICAVIHTTFHTADGPVIPPSIRIREAIAVVVWPTLEPTVGAAE